MKTKNKNKKTLNFSKATEKLVFDIFRAIEEIKKTNKNVYVKVRKT